jgi:hypothetical protein
MNFTTQSETSLFNLSLAACVAQHQKYLLWISQDVHNKVLILRLEQGRLSNCLSQITLYFRVGRYLE